MPRIHGVATNEKSPRKFRTVCVFEGFFFPQILFGVLNCGVTLSQNECVWSNALSNIGLVYLQSYGEPRAGSSFGVVRRV